MARRWTTEEENQYRDELTQLYVVENKTIHEIGLILGVAESTVYDRLIRLGIPTSRDKKQHANNKRAPIALPNRSERLAEFFGIMLGDGHVSKYQTFVTLGTKEYPYVYYVQNLMRNLFGVEAKIFTRKSGYRDVYIGSKEITDWLRIEGFVENKVGEQVGVPAWIFTKEEYMRAFIRGFFDTDGSVYKLRFGIQISITNHSFPLLIALHLMLRTLGYNVSKISVEKIYITKRNDIARFFKEISPRNSKHLDRFDKFTKASVPEWSKGAGCKPAEFILRRFESFPAHQ